MTIARGGPSRHAQGLKNFISFDRDTQQPFGSSVAVPGTSLDKNGFSEAVAREGGRPSV